MAANDKNNHDVANQIWSNAIQRSVQPLRWGIDFFSVKTLENGTSFHVRNAWVHIQCKEDGYKLTITFDDSKNQSECTGLLLSAVVPTIDDILTHGELSDKPAYYKQPNISERVAV